MKKILSVLLAAVMIVFSIPITAFADETIVFTDDATGCEFIFTPESIEISPGDTVKVTLSLKPNGRIYGLQAYVVLPEGFALVKDSGRFIEGVSKESLGWDGLAISETSDNRLIINGYTAENPYDKNAKLTLVEFTCTVADDLDSGALSLEEYFVLDSNMDKVASTMISHEIVVIHEAESDATSCKFRLAANKTTVDPGDTVNFVFSLIPNGRIYAFQAYLSLPENFSIVSDSVKLVDGVADLLQWSKDGDVAVTKTKSGGLIFSGYTAKNPYARANELKFATFSCVVGENARTGTIGLTDFFALDSDMEELDEHLGDFPTITVSTKSYTITIPDNVTVMRDGIKLTNGAAVNSGDKLTITANTPDGYELSSLTVNGKQFISGGEFTVGAENVIIAVSFVKIGEYSVAFPANVTVTRGGVALTTGARVNTGDVLTITANVPSGYRLNSLTVNGKSISNGSTYTVGSENITIVADIVRISNGGSSSGGSSGGSGSGGGSSITTYYTITIPDNVVVTRNGVELRNGATIYRYDELVITATAPEGKKLSSLTVNGTSFKSGDTYTVGSASVRITVSFEDIAVDHTITIPANVTVTRDNLILNNGDKIKEGDELFITALPKEGYKVSALIVNGVATISGNKYVVGNEDVIIVVGFEKLPDDPNAPFLTSDPNKRGWDTIYEVLSIPTDNTIMIDLNSSTVLPQRALYLLYNTGNKVQLKMDGKVSWSIDGKDIYAIARDIDLKVTLGTNNIPEEKIKGLIGNRDHLTFTLKHNGDLGFKAMLIIDVGEQYNNEKAVLYWFNNNEFKSEGDCDVLYGLAVMEMTHASEWLIAFEKTENSSGGDPSQSDPNTSEPGTSTPDTSDNPPALPGNQQTGGSNNNPSTNPDDKSKDKDKDGNPNTGGSRVSLTSFLALIAMAAMCLFGRRQKQQ